MECEKIMELFHSELVTVNASPVMKWLRSLPACSLKKIS